MRQLQSHLESSRGTGYTTILKLLQIMHEKGLVQRDESGHAHIYRAATTKSKTQKQIVGQMMDQLFEGSAHQLVLQALSSRKSSQQELAEIRDLLDRLEKETR